MKINERSLPQGMILDIQGDLTYANRTVFKAAIEKVRQTSCKNLILNFEQVRFVDSAGLGLLVLTAQSLKRVQSKVSLLKPQIYVREVMSLANIPTMIPIYEHEEDALMAHAA
jgi:anti-anti-sigma factor